MYTVGLYIIRLRKRLRIKYNLIIAALMKTASKLTLTPDALLSCYFLQQKLRDQMCVPLSESMNDKADF